MDFFLFHKSCFSIKGYHYVVSISGVIFLRLSFVHYPIGVISKWGGNWKMYFADLCIALFPYSFLPLKHIGEYLKEYNLWILDFIICPIIAFLVCWLCVMLSNGLQKIKLDWVFRK